MQPTLPTIVYYSCPLVLHSLLVAISVLAQGAILFSLIFSILLHLPLSLISAFYSFLLVSISNCFPFSSCLLLNPILILFPIVFLCLFFFPFLSPTSLYVKLLFLFLLPFFPNKLICLYISFLNL